MTSPSPRTTTLWTLAGLVLLAVNLRAGIAGVSPLLDDLQHQFGLSSVALGILTTVPVLALGAFAAVAPPLARRFGSGAALTGALALIAAGITVRLLPVAGAVPLFVGTAMTGAGIAIGNVLMPYVIKSAFPDRVGGMTGLALMVMSGGAALSSGLAVPLEGWGGWRLALGVWAVPAVLAVALWAPLAGRLARPVQAAGPTESIRRARLAWYVTGFMGMQSLTFYVLMSWLPAIMRDSGYPAATAGLMLSVMMLLGIPTGLVMPILAARRADQRSLVVVVMGMMIAGVGGLLALPGLGWVWTVVLGLALGAAFPLAFTLISLRSATPQIAAQLSGMTQTVGYLLAGLGPFAFGVLNGATGSWNVPLALLLIWLVPETVLALRAARPGYLGGGGHATGRQVELPEPADAIALSSRH
jgi:MFS transporter, CP family, cyanate transporter